MFCVGDRVPDNVLQEDLQHSPGLLVNETRNPLHTTATGQTSDSWFGDALDVVPQNLPVSLGASFAKALAALSSSSHLDLVDLTVFR